MNTTQQILDILSRHSRLEPGLNESELSRAKAICDFRFPPDLRELLGAALPLDLADVERPHFPDWRRVPNQYVQMRVNWSLEGVLFDIEQNDFWFSDWGARPANLSEALEVAEREFAHVPKLIPLWGHRYLPGEPRQSGKPVFSVWQTDVIYYGSNLLEYFRNEFFNLHEISGYKTTIRPISFWSLLAEVE